LPQSFVLACEVPAWTAPFRRPHRAKWAAGEVPPSPRPVRRPGEPGTRKRVCLVRREAARKDQPKLASRCVAGPTRTLRLEFETAQVFASLKVARQALDEWVEYHIQQRPHQSLDDQPPASRFARRHQPRMPGPGGTRWPAKTEPGLLAGLADGPAMTSRPADLDRRPRPAADLPGPRPRRRRAAAVPLADALL